MPFQKQSPPMSKRDPDIALQQILVDFDILWAIIKNDLPDLIA